MGHIIAPGTLSVPLVHEGYIHAQENYTDDWLLIYTHLDGTAITLGNAAQLAGGSPGAALEMNLDESTRLRRSILKLLETAIQGEKSSELFAATAQLAKQEKESFENVLGLLYSLLNDLLELSQGPKNSFSRNPDLQPELQALSRKIDFEWVLRATQGLDQLESRLRRNIGRQLGLDSLLVSLSLR